MLKKYNSEITLKIGKPIPYTEIKNSKLPHIEWAKKIREIVYNMSNS